MTQPPANPAICPCNPPMVMSASKRCGHCGLLRRDCANPMQRAHHQTRQILDKMTEIGALPPPPPPDEVHEYPAMMTHMTPDQLKAWIDAPGRIYLVHLPGSKAFPIKVPDEQHSFFVAMLTQLRIHLGPDVQAQSAQPVTNQPANQLPAAPAVSRAQRYQGANVSNVSIEFDEPFWECPNRYAENGDSRGECWNCGDER